MIESAVLVLMSLWGGNVYAIPLQTFADGRDCKPAQRVLRDSVAPNVVVTCVPTHEWPKLAALLKVKP